MVQTKPNINKSSATLITARACCGTLAPELPMRLTLSLAGCFTCPPLDIVVFDPATIADKATYAEPMQYGVGVSDVLVNGTPVIKGGDHTGATPGVVVRGPGWSGWDNQK
jgi:hypothetical protein